MIQSDYLRKIVEAVFNNPEPATGVGGWVQRGRMKITNFRPDGEKTSKKDKFKISISSGDWPRFYYNGSSFPDKWEFMEFFRWKNNTNNDAEVWARLAELYNITPDYSGETEEQRKRREVRQSLGGFIEETRKFLCECLQDPVLGAGARKYLDSRKMDYTGENGRFFGAYSTEIQNRLKAYLSQTFPGMTAIDETLKKLFPAAYFHPDEYALIIPYYSGRKCLGMVARLTSPELTYIDPKTGEEQKKRKYDNSAAEILNKEGYYTSLPYNKPVIIVEGYLDAIRIMQSDKAGKYGVFALTGASFTNSDNGSSHAQTLKRNGVKDIIYIPDYEIKDGKRVFKIAKNTLAALNKATTAPGGGGIETIKVLDFADSIPAGADKIDADSYISDHGDFWDLLDGRKCEAWEFLLKVAVAEHGDDKNALAAEALKIYKETGSQLAQERIKAILSQTNAGILEPIKAAGITYRLLERIDNGASGTEYRDRMERISEEFKQAVSENNPDKIRAAIQGAMTAQARFDDSGFDSQLKATFDDITGLIKTAPEYLETSWELYNPYFYRSGRAGAQKQVVRKMGFCPSEVTTISAPTSHGKTRIMVQIAVNLAQSTRKKFLYVSLEQDLRKLSELAQMAYIGDGWGDMNPRTSLRASLSYDKYDLDDGNASRYQSILDGVERYKKNVFPYLSFIKANANIDALCANILAWVRSCRERGDEVGGIFIDHLQLVEASGRNYSRTEELKAICNSLNDLAKDTRLPVICASQFNRSATSRSGGGFNDVSLDNIGESSAIERISADSYFVWQLNRCTDEEKGTDQKKRGIRAKRCYKDADMGMAANEFASEYMYIESLKARDYAAGCYCLVRYDAASGHIQDKSEIFYKDEGTQEKQGNNTQKNSGKGTTDPYKFFE